MITKNNGKNKHRDNGLDNIKVGYIYIYICSHMWAIVLNFHRATHESLIENESYQQSFEKTKNNGQHIKRDNINA